MFFFKTDVSIKYIYFDRKGTYSLAQARNRAVIEADGQILVFCDDRLRLAKNAINIFATYSRPKAWIWGEKDGVAKGFVENFSSVKREDLIRHGMFNERVQWYGGMTKKYSKKYWFV